MRGLDTRSGAPSGFRAWLFAALMFAAVSACSRGGPPRNRAAVRVDNASAVPPGRGARVIVDVSESNRGFASNGSVSLESLHRALDAALSAEQLNNPFQRCTLDADIHCPAAPLAPRHFASAALYAGASAALHRVLRRPGGEVRRGVPVEDPLDPYAVTALVTDGFQSTPAAFQPGARDDVACAAGADPSCMAALLRRRVDEGYGVWVVRLMMPFSGRYFAERRLDDAMWRRAQAHVSELNADAAWDGVRFSAASPDLNSGAGPYVFTGARPLLVFVLSRDVPRARRFVSDLTRRLRLERFTVRRTDDDVTASEWAPFEGLVAQLRSATRAQNGGVADEVVLDRATRSAAALNVPVRCTLNGRAPVALAGTLREGDIPPPPFARVELSWRMLRRAAREVQLPRSSIGPGAGPFTGTAVIDCTTMPEGDAAYEIGVWGRWSLDETGFADQWFVRESAETSFEMPERVYGLADLARTVVNAGLAREGALDRAVLRIHRD